jgi:hypothetical protein
MQAFEFSFLDRNLPVHPNFPLIMTKLSFVLAFLHFLFSQPLAIVLKRNGHFWSVLVGFNVMPRARGWVAARV